ncbi:MAG: MiaB/RimO family radical SAM methylthiotransferase [Myxococcales bacterium]|nr:MiaB/RimO family radical SAM methylthiotransferase [Myxococcales bacterium]
MTTWSPRVASPVRLALVTHGCKANQADEAALVDALAARLGGLELTGADDGDADLVVINSCTVTGAAAADARKAARRARAQNRGARILVTGCYAETDREALLSIPEVDEVVGNHEKAHLPRLAEALLAHGTGRLGRGEPEGGERNPARHARFREQSPSLRSIADLRALPRGVARPFVKVQDGCDYVCSFCIIPTARGPSRSRPLAEVAAEIRALAALGAREVVLTGIHLGHWGRQLTPRRRFGSMLEALLDRTESDGDHPAPRLRVSSLEPNEVDDHVIDLVTSHPRVCPHLHVPLQSGDDGILAAMKRVYRASYYQRVVERFRARTTTGAFGLDVMVGFPGEGRAQFETTHHFLKSLDVSYLHIFPYSVRTGTLAASMPDQVSPADKKERVATLAALSTLRREEHARRSVGTTVDVVVEHTRVAPSPHTSSHVEPGKCGGYSGNYVEVEISVPQPARSLVRATIVEACRGRVVGELEEVG